MTVAAVERFIDDAEELESIREVREFPSQPREELSMTIDENGRILLTTALEELSIPSGV